MRRVIALFFLLLFLPFTAVGEVSELSAGSKGEAVRSLQQRLLLLELTTGKVDGIYGKQTQAAVSEAQRLLQAAGYEVAVTGKADSQTIDLLFLAEAEKALRTLRSGSKGDRVRKLQVRLQDLKLLEGNADGDFGIQTEEAVKAFQEKMISLGCNQVIRNGVVTPEIFDLLMSDLSQYGFVAPIFFDDSIPLSLTPDALYSKACILLDASTGEVLFENNAGEPLYPASTTKIMTLLLALEKCNLNAQVTIPQCAADVAADSSLVPVYPGEEMAMRDLLYGLILRSGNDAANAIAELCSGDIQTFVDQMNQRALELGMSGTHFTNPHGYHDENHYSTAKDLAVLTRYGLTDPSFCQFVTCMAYTLPATKNREALLLQNHHEIFNPNSDMYIEGAAGVKSGYTSHAGFCYVGAAQREEKTLIAVILGSPGRNKAWTDLKRLFEYGFAS